MIDEMEGIDRKATVASMKKYLKAYKYWQLKSMRRRPRLTSPVIDGQPKGQRKSPDQQTYEAENILNRQFDQTAANQVWVTDTTELNYGIRLNKVRLHVVLDLYGLVLDLYGQYPVSWLITPTETAEGVVQVFEQARMKEGALAPLIHTDRGAAYTSKAFNQYLVVNDAQHSYSAPGTPADNAVIEHWWADFKAIWIAHLPKAQTLLELEGQVREGITYFTEKFISAKRNDLTAAEYRFGKAN